MTLQGAAIPTRRPLQHFISTRQVSRLAVVILACWACMLSVPELYRVSHALASLGLSVDNNGVIVDVTNPFNTPAQSPAALAGLQPGDRVDFRNMRCIPPDTATCSSLISVMGDLGGIGFNLPNFRAHLLILPKSGPPRTVALQAAAAPLPWLERAILLANTIAAVIFIGIAATLVWTRPSRMSWGFFLYAIWFNPGQGYTFYAWLQNWPLATLAEQVVEAFAQGAAYAGLLMFAIRFPTNTVSPPLVRLERLTPWLGLVIALSTLAVGADLFGIPTETLNDIIFGFGFIFDAAIIVLLLLRLRTLHPQDEQRMRWAIAGCVIGIPSYLIADLCQSSAIPFYLFGATLPQPVIGLLYFLQGVMAYFVGTALYRRRVVSVAIPLRRGATLSFFTFLLGVPVLYLHDRISHFTEHRDLPAWLWPLIVGPIVLVLLARLQDIAAKYTERVFNRRYHRARDTLHEASLAIKQASGFDDVDNALTKAPAAALRLASVAVFRLIDGMLVRVGNSIGWTETDMRTLDPAKFPAFITQLLNEKPVQVPRALADQPNLPRDDLFPCLAVPIRGGVTESVAVIFCGPHLSGADISYDERELLRDFAARAALGYDRVEANQLRQEIEQLRQKLAKTPGQARS